MKIAIYSSENAPMSYYIIRHEVTTYLNNQGISTIPFKTPDSIPSEAHIVWDPNAGGGFIPNIRRNHTNKPIIATVHGARLFALSMSALRTSDFSVAKIIKSRIEQKRLWRKHINDYEAIIPVSDYSAKELSKYLKIPVEKIHRIYNAVDHSIFKPKKTSKNYLLHISEYQPVKNVDRTIAAYIKASEKADLPDFWILSRKYPKRDIHPKIKILDDKYLLSEDLASLYQNAMAFVFPSLHEGFGIPIIEAMACGTAVMTSNITACPEVAAGAALLVNPKSIDSIANGLLEMARNKELRNTLEKKGIARAETFTWENTGKAYQNLFENIYDKTILTK